MRSAVEKGKRQARDQELGRMKLSQKYDTGKANKKPPPKELLDALAP